MEVCDYGKQICSVLVILGVLYRSSTFYRSDVINHNEISMLFALLRLGTESQARTSMALNVIMEFVSDQSVDVADMLLYFGKKLSVADPPSEWIYVIPMIHIFQGYMKPFEHPKLTSGSIKWTDKTFEMTKSKVQVISRYFTALRLCIVPALQS